MRQPTTPREFARHLIDFDEDDSATHAHWTLPRAALMAPKTMAPIPWPLGLAPAPFELKPRPRSSAPLPAADHVIVTWTVAEARALADVLTPGFPSKTAWYPYAHKFASHYASRIRRGAPADQAKRLGSYFLTKIGKKTVLCLKSELHMSQDGPKLPVKDLFSQVISETGAKVIITTGTAGAIGAKVDLGDVVVGRSVRFDCTREFKNRPFHNARYPAPASVPPKYLQIAQEKLMAANADKLPAASRPVTIIDRAGTSTKHPDIVTTDFFAYDTSTDTYGLQALGAAVEMGDAVLGLVCQELGANAPIWFAVRNASDPQIDGTLPPKEQRRQAGQIYEKFGYWTTVMSAIASWAVVAGT